MATLQFLQKTIQTNPFLLSALFLSFLLILCKLIRSKPKTNLPPSPPKLPIIGNLHQLGNLVHRSLLSLSAKHGPIMLLQLGHAPTLVVSSADAAREIMKTHDIVFSNRPNTTAANIFLYGCLDIGFAPYGEYWRQVKKLGVLELLSQKRVLSFQFVREEEVSILMEKIRTPVCGTTSGSVVDLSEMLIDASTNIVSRCVLGRRAEEEVGGTKFGVLARKIMTQMASNCVGDIFPSFGWIDNLTGLIPQLKATSRRMDAFLDQVIEEHRTDESEGKEDFVHTLLQIEKSGMLDIPFTQDNLKAILMDMIVGGTDTSSTTMEWAMANLMRNQNIMRKAQEEVRRVVGKKPKVEASDIYKMSYLKCVIKETLRLHPPAPLLVPRESSALVEMGGYTIPPKTRVLINALAIHTDSSVWEKADQFFPERFEKNPIDFKGQDFKYLPFGAGRRSCPGIAFGATATEFVIANLLYWFDWKIPDGETGKDLDMTEAFGLTVHKKIPLLLQPSLFSVSPGILSALPVRD